MFQSELGKVDTNHITFSALIRTSKDRVYGEEEEPSFSAHSQSKKRRLSSSSYDEEKDERPSKKRRMEKLKRNQITKEIIERWTKSNPYLDSNALHHQFPNENLPKLLKIKKKEIESDDESEEDQDFDRNKKEDAEYKVFKRYVLRTEICKISVLKRKGFQEEDVRKYLNRMKDEGFLRKCGQKRKI